MNSNQTLHLLKKAPWEITLNYTIKYSTFEQNKYLL